jgi:hypothetical protein
MLCVLLPRGSSDKDIERISLLGVIFSDSRYWLKVSLLSCGFSIVEGDLVCVKLFVNSSSCIEIFVFSLEIAKL